MDPISIIVSAVAAGATAAAKDTLTKALDEAYRGLKKVIVDKFGGKSDVEDALEGVEKKPDSEGRQSVLKEELATAKAEQDQQLVQQAQALLDLLNKEGFVSGPSYRATVSGSGAIAQGPGAVAAGERGVAVGGDVKGGVIITGDHSTVGDRDRDDER